MLCRAVPFRQLGRLHAFLQLPRVVQIVFHGNEQACLTLRCVRSSFSATSALLPPVPVFTTFSSHLRIYYIVEVRPGAAI